jgi:hypothetical protein
LVALLGGFATVNAAGLAWFWAAGGLPSLIYANLIWPFTNYSTVNVAPYGLDFRQLYWSSFTASLTPLISRIGADAVSAVLCLPFVVVMGLPVVLAGCVAAFRRSAFDRTTLPYWFAGGALWLSEMHRKDLPHIVWASPLLIVLAFSYGRQLRGKWVKPALQMVTLAAALLASLNPLVALVANHKVVTRRGTMYNSFPQNTALEYLNAHMAPGEPLFVYPYAPLYYFLSAASNPTRYSILMYDYNTNREFQDAVRTLETAKVRYVVWDRSFPSCVSKAFPSFRMPAPEQLIMEPYLMDRYRVVADAADGYQVLERKDPLLTTSALKE